LTELRPINVGGGEAQRSFGDVGRQTKGGDLSHRKKPWSEKTETESEKEKGRKINSLKIGHVQGGEIRGGGLQGITDFGVKGGEKML